MSKNNTFSKIVAPLLGAGAIGVCPLCWAGSAALLTYVGLGSLIPLWPWLAVVLLVAGFVGLMFDFKSHKNIYPIEIFILGSLGLYLGRYVLGQGLIWVSGAVLIIIAIIYNKKLFSKVSLQEKEKYVCSECLLEYGDKEWAEKCEFWCKEHHTCNIDIIKHAIIEGDNK